MVDEDDDEEQQCSEVESEWPRSICSVTSRRDDTRRELGGGKGGYRSVNPKNVRSKGTP